MILLEHAICFRICNDQLQLSKHYGLNYSYFLASSDVELPLKVDFTSTSLEEKSINLMLINKLATFYNR